MRLRNFLMFGLAALLTFTAGAVLAAIAIFSKGDELASPWPAAAKLFGVPAIAALSLFVAASPAVFGATDPTTIAITIAMTIPPIPQSLKNCARGLGGWCRGRR